jgi:hypothetical protein
MLDIAVGRRANDAFSIEHGRGYLKQFAGAERVYAFMLAEAAKSNPPHRLQPPVP